jgi:hypothetical protein
MRAVKKCINEHNVDKILLCTDEKEAITAFEKEFPGKIFFTDSYRAEPGDTEGIHISKKSKREHHNYLLGLEVLCDTMYLSKCDYLVFSHSNVATAAMFINGNKYDGTYMVED